MFEPPQHVIDAYKEPHRKYHNLDHIQSILAKIPLFHVTYALSASEVEKLEIMAWYHDVVYVPGEIDNEILSGNLLDRDIREHRLADWSDQSLREIGGTIYKTRWHVEPSSWLASIFFDLDLADMGTDAYVENSFKIREEFGQFSDLEWLAGRQKFLADFLSRPFIYHTSLGYKLWEEKARRNMENELHFLKGKYGV